MTPGTLYFAPGRYGVRLSSPALLRCVPREFKDGLMGVKKEVTP